jgi:hypothetical protein
MVLLAGLLLALPAAASPVTVVMTGVWTSVNGSLLFPPPSIGDPYTATLTYEDSVPNSSAPPFGDYVFGPGDFSFTLTTGGYVFSSTPSGFNEITLSNLPSGSGGDDLYVYAESLVGSPGLPAFDVSYLNPSLFDFSGAALGSVALTGIPWTTASWPSSRSMVLFAGVSDGPFIDLGGTIDGLTVVPEHGTLGLMAVGLAGLAQRARRRR